jgi:dipeptide transport system substrate-binding protein
MIANLGMDFASIMSAEYADVMTEAGTPEKVDLEPVGTGPFQLVQYQKDAVIRYKAHPDYWAGKAALDNLVFAITPDASVRYQKLKAGECHVMPYPNPADIEAMKGDSDITLLEQEGLNVGYLAYNTTQAPFDNPMVRKALNAAINKEAILENLETSIWAMPVQRPYNPNARRMAELIQADWAAIGVTADITTYEWGEYLKRSKELDRDGAVLLGWTGDNGDPDNFLAVLLGCDGVGGSNRAQWCDPAFEEVIQQAKVTSDPEQRTALYQAAQMIVKNQAPWATIAHSVVFKPIRNEVQNFKIDPFGGHIFYGVDLAE